MNKKIKIAGVPFDPVTYDDVLTAIEEFVAGNNKSYIATPNPEMVIRANEDESFRLVLEGATLAIPDGIGILWAASYLSTPLPKTGLGRKWQLYSSLVSIAIWPRSIRRVLPSRVTGTDLFQKVVATSEEKKWKIFLLGAGPGVAKAAIKKLRQKHPEAELVGCYEGTPNIEDESEIIDEINKAKPDILFVAYGSPDQEYWIHRNLFKLSSVKVAVGVGGAFDFVAGEIRRAPKTMRKLGLEWLWRLMRQPKRHNRIRNATQGFVKLISDEKIYQDS